MLISTEYNEKTRRAMAMLNEKELSFELIQVSNDDYYYYYDDDDDIIKDDFIIVGLYTPDT